MARQGSYIGLLDELHAPECDGTEYCTVEATVPGHRPSKVVPVFLVWCGECGAADWERVDD